MRLLSVCCYLAVLAACLGIASCGNRIADTSWYATDCSQDIQSGQGLGIQAIPDELQNYRQLYCKYTEIGAPNGKPIRIFAQNEISNEQLLYARSLLEFYLEDFPGSRYGSDKSDIANAIANNGAVLSMLNGHDGEFELQYDTGIIGQPLYEDETPTIGSRAYIDNDFERRDAAFEEILHFVHDAGIGVDFPGAMQGAAPEFQRHIRAAATNGLPENKGLWADDRRAEDWLEELRLEGSITQEYLAAVIDSYYGLWGAFTEAPGGMWGMYVAKTRDEIATDDPMGYEVVRMFFGPYLTFPARVDPGFSGTFLMNFDAAYLYTHKSQYLVNVSLLGANDAGIEANDQDNLLAGNQGNNRIDARGGTDTVAFSGEFENYEIVVIDSEIQVADSRGIDATDRLLNVEFLQFADRRVPVSDL
ncbi:MAG: hypothetical protein HKN13_08805 [Rhodothermales bacterium]|nr:hypothetical protein [Rhodothermales bacterium]